MKPSRFGTKIICCLFFALCVFQMSAQANEFTDEQDKATKGNTPAQLIIDKITCQGNSTTKCSFVTNKYYQKAGDVLNPDEIADAKLRLGTLIQFRSVSIHLKKGHKRGHVIVVFEVNEADNLQYEIGVGYDHTNVESGPSFDNDISRFALHSKVTNFNFWGTGKELSLSVSGARHENESQGVSKSIFIDEFNNYTETVDKFNDKNTGNSYSLSLRYYDPHLFDSSHYYLSADIQFEKYRNERVNAIHSGESSGTNKSTVTKFTFDDNYNTQSILLGRRFGRHSFVSVDVSTTNKTPSDNTSYGVTYGWNSENDSLFPTKGSAFTTRISKFKGNPQVSLHYKNNIAFGENNIVMYGTNVAYNEFENQCTACYLIIDDTISASIFGRYSRIRQINRAQGVYSGWHIGFYYGQGNIGEDLYNYHFSGINAGYTYQTSNMIYRFSLGLNQQENK